MLEPLKFHGDDGFGGHALAQDKAVGSKAASRVFTTLSQETLVTPPKAARDPLFYIHHAAIDRMWEVWSKTRHRNYVDYPDEWRVVAHKFPAINGKQVIISNCELLDTAALGYVYPKLDSNATFEGDPTRFYPPPFGQDSSDPEPKVESLTMSLPSDSSGSLVYYFWFKRLQLQPSVDRRYTFWIASRDNRAVALRLPTVGVFENMDGGAPIHISLPFALTRAELAPFEGAFANDPQFELWYLTGEVDSSEVPENAESAVFDDMTMTAQRTILSGS